jgi:hypothetical protein
MEVSAQFNAPAALLRRKEPRYPLDRKLGAPRAGLDAVEKRKMYLPPGNQSPPVTIPTELSRLLCVYMYERKYRKLMKDIRNEK